MTASVPSLRVEDPHLEVDQHERLELGVDTEQGVPERMVQRVDRTVPLPVLTYRSPPACELTVASAVAGVPRPPRRSMIVRHDSTVK